MALLDFKEIPQSNVGGGLQDEFELFARDFFDTLGFKIEEGPDRGPDGGRDLIIKETRSGSLGDTTIKWLVSCKHKAHSGSSVLENDEEDIPGRVEQFGCDGFIGFYSTIPSSGLSNKINSFKDRFEICVYDNEKIEKVLLENSNMDLIIKRYFPLSYEKQIKEVSPSIIYNKYYSLKCESCGKDLIVKGKVNNYQGLVAFAYDMDYSHKSAGVKKIVKVYCACKGKCDSKIESNIQGQIITRWVDISDLAIPFEYMKWVMSVLNQMRDGREIYTDEAFEQLKNIMLHIAQVTMRQPSVKEMQRVKLLSEIPDGL